MGGPAAIRPRMIGTIDFQLSIENIYSATIGGIAHGLQDMHVDLKLKDLRYLVAVADSGHFGHAAAKCFVSQPTLSAQLLKLEQSLGVQLIERSPRHAALTPAGEEIAQRARAMLEQADSIVSLAQARRDPLAGVLRVALLPTIGPYLLPAISARVRRSLPRLELMLYEYQTAPML